ncbi:MAG TPA: DNA polymerase III subunit gamma/tau [Solirubrobacteraceae bacterium]|nr:DNA polymerase III subunit gamma/tau [Solirubrobacteraceae bacterium]
MSTGPSLYRRHRPRTFADVVGQEQVVRTLTHAVQRDRVHHAYLFVGSRGTGKTSMAKILAACLNCERGPTVEPCGVCESCVAIANATSLDVIEMDAASNNSVDDIRDLRERVAFAPVSGKHKVYILDEAHMLSPQAWNAFLKTLEEPPPRTIFVLATTEAQKVLPTVVDRCHRFDFGRPTVEQVARVVSRVAAQEQIEIETTAVATIARHATGSFRDALGTLEQLLTYAGPDPITTADVLAVLGVADAEQLFEAVDAIVAADGAAAMRAAARLTESGRDPGQLLRDLEIHGRELLAVQVLGEVPEELRLTPERDARLLAQAQALTRTDAVRLLDLVSAALEATANGGSARIQLELVLVKAAAPEVDPSTPALLARIERLEAALARGGGGAASRPTDLKTAQQVGQIQSTPGVQAASAAEVAAVPEAAPTPEAAPAAEAALGPEVALAPKAALAPEAAAPEAALAADTATGPPALETVAANWPAVIDVVRKDNEMLAALLADAKPVSLEGHDVTVAFPSDSAFLKRKAEQDEYRRAASEALRTVVGTSLALRYELSDEEPPEVSAVGISHEELVRRLVEEFDAQVLDDDDQEA